MKNLIKQLKPGSLYAITSKVGCGKTHFCLKAASLITESQGKVLYLSDTLLPNEITDKIKAMPSKVQNNIEFKSVYSLRHNKLETLLNQNTYAALILDPFEIYAYDIDVGELKELAIQKNIIVILTKHLSRPSLKSNRKHAVLSDIKFNDTNIFEKFIAYTDFILFIKRIPETAQFEASFGKNLYCETKNFFNIDATL